jgi:hypothetical protein
MPSIRGKESALNETNGKSRLTLSIAVFGCYLAVVGLALAIAPDISLPLLGLARSTDAWVRIVGVLTGILAFYFLNSARDNDRSFFQATVVARIIFFAGVTTLVLVRLAEPRFVAFGVIDLAGALWTWLALRGR